MNLYEFEGKKLFRAAGILIPRGVVVKNLTQARVAAKKFPQAVVKAQTTLGKRKKAGAVIQAQTAKEIESAVKKLLGTAVRGEKVERVLVEEKLPVAQEFFISLTYDTREQAPVLLFSKHGGIEVEELAQKFPRSIFKIVIDPLLGLKKGDVRKLGQDVADLAEKLWQVFWQNDAKLVEINPLIQTKTGRLVAGDAKVVLDRFALFRHPELGLTFKDIVGRIAKTDAEMRARYIDMKDFRGTAGSVYFDLPGDIAIIASGGGGSLVCMDALLAFGGKPANYTEYSGNPPARKVEQLTKITLAKPGLSGCWVVGGTANFTDVYETMSGFLGGLRQTHPKPKYPIVVRREGPRAEEAFALLSQAAQKDGFNIHLFNSRMTINEAARIMVELARKYKKGK